MRFYVFIIFSLFSIISGAIAAEQTQPIDIDGWKVTRGQKFNDFCAGKFFRETQATPVYGSSIIKEISLFPASIDNFHSETDPNSSGMLAYQNPTLLKITFTSNISECLTDHRGAALDKLKKEVTYGLAGHDTLDSFVIRVVSKFETVFDIFKNDVPESVRTVILGS